MLHNTTLCIFFKQDCPERIRNLNIVLQYYTKNAPDMKILVMTTGAHSDIYKSNNISVHELNDTYGEYHRTHAFNELSKLCITPYIIFGDTDVIVNTNGLINSIGILENDPFAGIVFPHNGIFVNYTDHSNINSNLDIDNLYKQFSDIKSPHTGYTSKDMHITNYGGHTGGMVACVLSIFQRVGGYNPNFIGWGYEDNELLYRMSTFGYNISYVRDRKTIAWHLDHNVPGSHQKTNSFYDKNKELYGFITKNYTKVYELQQYISGWAKDIQPKATLVISSFNQCKRLKYSVESAIKQSWLNTEVIVADDNSTDGTHSLVSGYTQVKLCVNPYSKAGKYTLASNWNNAITNASSATKRIILSNGDMIFSYDFVTSHMDSRIGSNICFGLGERTTEAIEYYMNNTSSYKQLIKDYTSCNTLEKDIHHDTSAYTWMQEYSFYYPWGYNFSVDYQKFNLVGGFPNMERYGGEDQELCKKLVQQDCKVLSNKYAYNIHLWHPQFNNHQTTERVDYKL